MAILPYQPIRSAFTILETPTRMLHDWNQTQPTMRFMNDKQAIIYLVKYVALSAIFHPVVAVLSPVSLITDVAMGVFEIGFAAYKGHNREDLKNIAKIKFIASPIQHLTYITVSALAALVGAIFVSDQFHHSLSFEVCLILGGTFVAIPSYQMSQICVANLPDWARPGGFNIFIDGGATDQNGNKYTDYEDAFRDYMRNRPSSNKKPSYESYAKPVDSWQEMCQKAINELNLKEVKADAGKVLNTYDIFKNGIINKLNPQQLYGLENGYTKAGIIKAYKKLSMATHPDKNLERGAEATGLIKLVNEARVALQ
jgi:hypothetical protein